jgi:hypothetical protein
MRIKSYIIYIGFFAQITSFAQTGQKAFTNGSYDCKFVKGSKTHNLTVDSQGLSGGFDFSNEGSSEANGIGGRVCIAYKIDNFLPSPTQGNSLVPSNNFMRVRVGVIGPKDNCLFSEKMEPIYFEKLYFLNGKTFSETLNDFGIKMNCTFSTFAKEAGPKRNH